MKKRILVAGGAGFLGSHLVEALILAGHELVCVDNFYTGDRQNISHLPATIIHHDICQPLNLKVDEIYNLACPASPIHYQDNPIKTIKTNFLGTLNLLELAQKNQAKFLQASTSEVYGDPLVHPQNESYWGNVNPIGVRSCYDEGKRCAETLCFDFHRSYGVDIRVVRIFNTYGPKMHPADGRVVSNFIMQALRNESITIFGEGKQTRSFCYVDDLIKGMIRVMESNYVKPVNLGNPAEFTVLELASQIIKQTASPSKLTFCPLPEDDPKQRKPDISVAKSLGWAPTISLQEGLASTISYFKTRLVGQHV